MEKLLKERTARQPHPHSGIYGPISIQKKLIKYLEQKYQIYYEIFKLHEMVKKSLNIL